MYICEDGLVHYCSQQRGYPGKPLEQYTREDIRREYLTEKVVRAVLHGELRALRFVLRFRLTADRRDSIEISKLRFAMLGMVFASRVFASACPVLSNPALNLHWIWCGWLYHCHRNRR